MDTDKAQSIIRLESEELRLERKAEQDAKDVKEARRVAEVRTNNGWSNFPNRYDQD